MKRGYKDPAELREAIEELYAGQTMVDVARAGRRAAIEFNKTAFPVAKEAADRLVELGQAFNRAHGIQIRELIQEDKPIKLTMMDGFRYRTMNPPGRQE